ncbi:delta-lactam-biosynthetic de-N-acetylase [Bacillaceae bacterium S4-13-58]
MNKIIRSFICSFILVLLLPTITSAQSYGWGFQKRGEGLPPIAGTYENILQQNNGYFYDPSGEKVLYLTFDNGYEQGYTDQVLDVLKEKEVPATFFVTGHYVESSEELIQRMVQEGHIVGNHSWSHADFTTLGKEEIKEELRKVEEAVANISTQQSMSFLRPPRGTFTPESLSAASELGYANMFWSLAYVDWETNNQKGWKHSYEQVMKQVHPGAIMLLHAVSSDNAEALSHLIDDLREEGYTFKSLNYFMRKQMLPEPFVKDFG